ncbi:MAG: ribonuclease HII [Alphaproteobacteria bacterium]
MAKLPTHRATGSTQPANRQLTMQAIDPTYEQSFGGLIAGIDEAGRGPWAGPVVAAAVVFYTDKIPEGVHDSKKLSAVRREQIFDDILKNAHVGIGLATPEEIDKVNILQATFLAMQRAYGLLGFTPDIALIDGNKCPSLPCKTKAIIGGDALCPSIAAASIIAKVTRDRIMADLAKQHPAYGWERNAGYGTTQHQKALADFGVTPHHRKSYKPIQLLLESATLSA